MKKYLTFLLIIVLTSFAYSQTPRQVKVSQALTNEAIELYKVKKYDIAKDRLEKALKLNPQNVKAHEMAALLFYIEKDFKKAQWHAEKAIRLNSKSAAGYYVLGMISYQNQENEKARFQLGQALKYLKDPEKKARAKNIVENLKRMAKKRPVRNFRKNRIKKQNEPSPEPGTYQPFIAVFNFDESNQQAQGLGKTLSEMLITALIQDQKYIVMERLQLEKILQEQSLSQTGVIDEETALKVGKLSGLEAVILGSVSRLNRTVEADVRLIDVETGKALGAASGTVDDVEKLRDLANELAGKLKDFAGLIKPKNEEADSTQKGN